MNIIGTQLPFEDFTIQGNAHLDEARIIFVAHHDLSSFRKNTAFVDRIYQNHLVLVENIPLGKECIVEEGMGLDFEVVRKVSGWDLPGSDDRLKAWQSKESCLNDILREVEQNLIEENWRELIKKSQLWLQFLEAVPTNMKKEKVQLLLLLDKGMKSTFRDQFISLQIVVFQEFYERLKGLYKATFQARIASLQHAIRRVPWNEKVIVSLSMNFLARNPELRGEEYENSGVWQLIKHLPHVVITPKNSHLEIDDQPELWNSNK